MSEFSLILVLQKENKQNSNMTWQKYKKSTYPTYRLRKNDVRKRSGPRPKGEARLESKVRPGIRTDIRHPAEYEDRKNP